MTHKVQRTLLCDSVIFVVVVARLQFLSFLTSFKQLAIAIPMGISNNNNNNNEEKTLPRVYNSLCIALTFFLSFSDVSRTHVLLLSKRFKELAKKKIRRNISSYLCTQNAFLIRNYTYN